MASSGPVIRDLSAALRVAPSAVDRMLRPLREASLVPLGAPGRGSAVGNYEASHLANVILGCAGAQPSDAADAARAVRALRGAEWTSAFCDRSVGVPEFLRGDFGTVLERLIRGDTPEDLAPPHGITLATHPNCLRITLCLDPLEAVVDIRAPGKSTTSTFWYQPPQPALGIEAPHPEAGMQRSTIIWGNVILAARELWRDTVHEQIVAEALKLKPKLSAERQAELMNLGDQAIEGAARRRGRRRTGAIAPSENETGATPGRAAPAERAQTAETEGCSPEQAHSTGERESSQSPSDSASMISGGSI